MELMHPGSLFVYESVFAGNLAGRLEALVRRAYAIDLKEGHECMLIVCCPGDAIIEVAPMEQHGKRDETRWISVAQAELGLESLLYEISYHDEWFVIALEDGAEVILRRTEDGPRPKPLIDRSPLRLGQEKLTVGRLQTDPVDRLRDGNVICLSKTDAASKRGKDTVPLELGRDVYRSAGKLSQKADDACLPNESPAGSGDLNAVVPSVDRD
jgi:hypothetical protein